jgi:hypothetical protein
MIRSEYALHLWSMTTGQPHPAAESTIINCPRVSAQADVYSVSVTNSRLALLLGKSDMREGVGMFVWNWRTGTLLLVSDPPVSATAPNLTRILG